MKTIVMRPTEVEVAAIRLRLPVSYGEEDMPDNFPFRERDTWTVIVDIDTGAIRGWPQGVEYDLCMKVVDTGIYELLDAAGNTIASIDEDYVPHGVVSGRYGDYVELNINGDGVITNWPKSPNVSAFFEVE